MANKYEGFPLHHAIASDQPEVLKLLLSQGAFVNAVNKNGTSALHVAVSERNMQYVRILLRYHCDVNLQDIYGETALHNAVVSHYQDMIDELCACERIDLTLRNVQGFNVLHYAALMDNVYAVKKLLACAPHLDVEKEDGYTALHLAAANGHREVAAILLSQNGGCAKVDLHNNKERYTPLHLATTRRHWSLVELLVHHNADVCITDFLGETVLHYATRDIIRPHAVSTLQKQDSPLICSIWQNLAGQDAKTEAIALACFLVSVDRSCKLLEIKNDKGITPLDLLKDDPQAADLLRSYKYQSHSIQLEIEHNLSTSRVELPVCRISNVSQLGLRGTENIAGSDNAAEYRDIPEIIADTRQQNRVDPSSGVLVDCTRCGHSVGKILSTHIVLDVQMATNEASVINQRWYNPENKSLNISLEQINNREKELDRKLKELKTKIANLEEVAMCNICMEHNRNVAFLCGHGACKRCAAPLTICHMCRKRVRKKINLYL